MMTRSRASSSSKAASFFLGLLCVSSNPSPRSQCASPGKADIYPMYIIPPRPSKNPQFGPEIEKKNDVGVEGGAEVVAAPAAVENRQTRHLCREFRFGRLGQKALKLGGESGERVGKEQSCFSVFVHRRFPPVS